MIAGVEGVAGVSGVTGLGGVTAAARALQNPPADGAGPASAAGFAAAVNRSMENLQAMQSDVDRLAVQAATGDLTDVHDYTIAATQARLTTELTVAVRNKAVEAFSEIMRLQA
ncbi:flagellar hook-basal body complex protein FliE [Thalassiella azotivora]